MTGLERIANTFERLRSRNEPALVTYVMGGDPNLRGSEEMARACVDGGADLLEIGIPFSDPIADGPTIQRAAERALAAGTRARDCLKLAATLREHTEAPIALMGYLNPVIAFGLEAFLDECRRSGVDALILPDLPPEEAERICELARARGVAIVFLLAPTSTPERRRRVFDRASGFIYFVSVTGVTGARTELPADLGERLDALRAESPLPLVVGFGVSSPEQARALAAHANGVVVGSAIVSRIAAAGPVKARAEKVRRFVKSLKAALTPQP